MAPRYGDENVGCRSAGDVGGLFLSGSGSYGRCKKMAFTGALRDVGCRSQAVEIDEKTREAVT